MRVGQGQLKQAEGYVQVPCEGIYATSYDWDEQTIKSDRLLDLAIADRLRVAGLRRVLRNAHLSALTRCGPSRWLPRMGFLGRKPCLGGYSVIVRSRAEEQTNARSDIG